MFPNNYSHVHNQKYVSSQINPILRQCDKQNLHFNTKFRNKYYETSSTDFNYDLPQPCTNIISLKLSSICMPNSWYLFSHERENNRFIIEIESKNNPPYEANYLNLDCSKSIKRLDWTPKLAIEQSISMTCAWYKNFYENNLDMYTFSVNQIKQFE